MSYSVFCFEMKVLVILMGRLDIDWWMLVVFVVVLQGFRAVCFVW